MLNENNVQLSLPERSMRIIRALGLIITLVLKGTPTLSTRFVYDFHTILIINSDYLIKQNKLI